jgi:hypothetical protein
MSVVVGKLREETAWPGDHGLKPNLALVVKSPVLATID